MDNAKRLLVLRKSNEKSEKRKVESEKILAIAIAIAIGTRYRPFQRTTELLKRMGNNDPVNCSQVNLQGRKGRKGRYWATAKLSQPVIARLVPVISSLFSLQHALPERFRKIRFYGILGGREKKEKIDLSRVIGDVHK